MNSLFFTFQNKVTLENTEEILFFDCCIKKKRAPEKLRPGSRFPMIKAKTDGTYVIYCEFVSVYKP
jgi:hypothetical protein